MHEAGLHRAVEERTQRVEVAVHVEDRARFGVNAQLRPGEHLEELVQRAVAARQHDERVRRVGHRRLPLVHRLGNAQAGQAGVGDLLGGERAGDHAVRFAPGVEHGVRYGAHQADVTAAVDQADAALRKHAAEGGGGCGERRSVARIRAAVDCDRR